MDGLLHMRVNGHHALVEVAMLAHQHFRIPSSGHEDGIDTAGQGRGEAMGDLQTDHESVRDDHRCEPAVAVVGWVGEEEVEVGQTVVR